MISKKFFKFLNIFLTRLLKIDLPSLLFLMDFFSSNNFDDIWYLLRFLIFPLFRILWRFYSSLINFLLYYFRMFFSSLNFSCFHSIKIPLIYFYFLFSMLFEYQKLRSSTLNEQHAKQINIKGTRYSEIIIKNISKTHQDLILKQ